MTNPYQSPRPTDPELSSSFQTPGSVWIVTWLIYSLCALATLGSVLVMFAARRPQLIPLVTICLGGWLSIHQYRAVLLRRWLSSMKVGLFFVILVPVGLAFLTAGSADVVYDVRAAAMVVVLAMLPLGIVMLWWGVRVRAMRDSLGRTDEL